MSSRQKALLALEDGSVYYGSAFGASKTVVGEAVFNTSMTGYQEILTDPSYYAQIVTMTAVEIGNYGVNADDAESEFPKPAGFVIRQLSPVTSNWRSEKSLNEYLKEYGIPGIEGVDTRAITKKLRVEGAMNACLTTEDIDPEEAVRKAKKWPGLAGVDYVKEVTCKEPFIFDEDHRESTPFSVPGTELQPPRRERPEYYVIAYHYGAKRSIFRKLRYHGFKVEIVPADFPAESVIEKNPDAVFLSNGPGDPSALDYTHKIVNELIPKFPIFGICLGHQLITHALGAPTFKLKFGHRGGNQPVKNLETGKVSITSQNHGYASTREELDKCGAIVTEVNLNDDTVEGLRLKDYPVFSVQYHPEAAPGPNDADPLFEDFYQLVKDSK